MALTAEMGVGPWGVPVGPILWVTAGGAEPGCPVVAVPSGCPGVVALPPSMMVFCWELIRVCYSLNDPLAAPPNYLLCVDS